MVENSFNRALREVISGEFSNIPLHEAEIPHTFSNGFLRKMDKLTKAEKNRFWRMTSTAPKRFAVIMASLLIITLTACSIPSVRAAVVGFIKETYDNCVRLFTGDVGSNKISDQYLWRYYSGHTDYGYILHPDAAPQDHIHDNPLLEHNPDTNHPHNEILQSFHPAFYHNRELG